MGSSQTASKPAHSRKKTSAIKTGIRQFNPQSSVMANVQTMPSRTNNASNLERPRHPPFHINNEDEDEPTTFFDINEPVVTINLNKNLQRARGQNTLNKPPQGVHTEDSAAKAQTGGVMFRKGNSMTFNDDELVTQHPMQKQSSRNSNNASFLFASPTSTNTPHHYHH